jgi:hypothetical protein
MALRCRNGGKWLDMCIMSYYLDEARPWDSRRYMLTGTMLKT